MASMNIAKEIMGYALGTKEGSIKFGSKDSMEILISEINEINTNINELEKTILDLNISENKINDMVKIIEEIKDINGFMDQGIKQGFQDPFDF